MYEKPAKPKRKKISKNKREQKRRAGFNRRRRLKHARAWLKEKDISGEGLVRSYMAHYSLDEVCTLKELSMLGFEVDLNRVQHLLEQNKLKQREA